MITPRKALVLIEQLPAAANLWQQVESDAAWTSEAHLLAAAVDQLRILAWQQTKDGQSGRRQPEPIPRPATHREQQAKSARLQAQARAFRERQARRALMRAEATRGRN